MPSLVLGYPGLEDSTIVLLLSISLFAAGIERISVGIFSEEFAKKKSSRISYIGLGVAIIALPVFAIAYPEPTEEILIIIVAAALLLSGVAAIIRSIKDKNIKGLRKALTLGLGLLSTGLAIQALLYPALGLVILMLIVSVGLLVNGIEILALGLTGRRFIFNQESSK